MPEEGHAMANIKEEQIKNDLFQIYFIFTLICKLYPISKIYPILEYKYFLIYESL